MVVAKKSYSQWIPGLKESLDSIRWHPCLPYKSREIRFKYGQDAHSLWVLCTIGPGGPQWGLRCCYDPQGQLKLTTTQERGLGKVCFNLRSAIGNFRIELRTLESKEHLLRYTTWLTPRLDINVELMPRDFYLLGKQQDPICGEGKVLGIQNGNGAAYAFITQSAPRPAAGLYFQQLTSLNEYFQSTETDAKEIVGGEWPEVGIQLPASKKPLTKGVKICLSDAFVVPWSSAPPNETIATHWFLEGMAEIYPHLERPEPTYFDWPAMANRTLRSLASKGCTRIINGRTYLNAYVGSDRKPPESMVHCAILVPLVEYDRWKGGSSLLSSSLIESLASFYDAKIGSVVRWLPNEQFDNDEHSPSEEEDVELIDSWYLYHVMMNLARLTQLGIKEAEEVFRSSLPYAIEVAKHFEYRWPVFFKMSSLKVTKHETAPGEGGEQDVPGLYIKLMMLAHQIQPDRVYIDEAENAAKRLKGLGFKLLYQTNNTVLGSEGLLLLWKATFNRDYLDLSLAGIANVVAKMWFWECRYGNAKEYISYLGVAPLENCEYTAAYEEAEVFATAQGYLKELGEHAPESARLLLAEYFKYFLARGRYYFPSELPAHVVSDETKEGHLDRKLAIPIEDLRTGWQKSGQVGQETYGAATPFILSTRAYLRFKKVPFLVYSDAPIGFSDYQSDKGQSGQVLVNLGASSSAASRLCILPLKGRLPQIELIIDGKNVLQPSNAHNTKKALTFLLPGDSKVSIKWTWVQKRSHKR